MSTKTTFKRIALVTVAALSVGMLSSVSTASAVNAASLVASVGPNGATSITVVGGNNTTTGALVRLDVAASDTSTAGLSANETITASVIGVPTASGKTLVANGGSLSDTSTAVGNTNHSDFSMLESAAQTSGTPGVLAAGSISRFTNWKQVVPTLSSKVNLDSATGLASWAEAADGQVGSLNTSFANMDSVHETSNAQYTKSYYVTILPRVGANVLDQGVYTVQFQLTDANGVVRGTKTVTIDFVSTAATSGAVLGWTTAGTFQTNAALATTDATGYTAYAKLALTNRSGGLVRTNLGANPVPTVSIRDLAAVPVADTMTANLATMASADNGVAATDFGTDIGGTGDTANGTGSLVPSDGVYGVAYTHLPATASSTTQTYQFWAAYGNATIATSALTLYSATTTAVNTNTTVTLTAAGASAADLLAKTGAASGTWTVPTSTTTATLKFQILSGVTPVAAAAITATPTWSGVYGSGAVTPATSTTGTVYTTDSNGNFSITVTNSAPAATASVAIVLTGAAAFGSTKYTATVTWATPVATTIDVADPITGVYVKTGSTNVTTVIVKDQFGNPVSGDLITVTIPTTTDANYSATTVNAPITTGANGTATFSLVGGATTATSDSINFTSVKAAQTAIMKYNYVTTVPVVATMATYHGTSWGTAAATLTPATGIYQTGTTTELTIVKSLDTSKSLASVSDSATDALVNLRFYALASGSVAATGAVVTVTAGTGGWILDTAGLPSKSRNFIVNSTGYTSGIQVLATGTGDVTFTATSGTVTASATLKVANTATDARFVKITSATTGTANGTGVPVTVTVTDRYGNAVSGVDVNVVASGVGSFMGGSITNSFKTDASGVYTFLANTVVSEGGVAKFTAASGTSADFTSAAGYVSTTVVDSTLAAGASTASQSITFAAGSSASDVAQTATDAAAEATDAANAATDAANAAAEAADAATAAAQDAADAVAALSAQVATLISGLKAQLTALTNLVIKIQKKVKA